MSLILDTNAGGEKTLPETGLNQAVLVTICDLGTQVSEQWGAKRQVLLTFGLTEQSHVFDEEKGAEPLHVSKTFTMSLHKKSALRSAIRGILGHDIDGRFDLFQLLGKNCTLNLVEVQKEDTKYVNIDSFAPLMKDREPKEMKTNSFSFFDYKQEDFDGLHEWQQKKIELTEEYQERTSFSAPQ